MQELWGRREDKSDFAKLTLLFYTVNRMEKKTEFDTELLKTLGNNGDGGTLIEHILNSLFNTSPDYIYLKDRNSRFILANESILKAFNLKDRSDIAGKTDFDFFTEEHARNTFEVEQQIMETGVGKSNYIEKETRENGTESWVASTKVPLFNGEKKVVGLFGISRDITLRKLAEIENDNRAKELECFIEISKAAKKSDLSAEGYIRKIADLIPSYLEHAYIESVRIVIGNKAIKKRNFVETPYVHNYRISDENRKIGRMEIFTSWEVNEFPVTTDQVLKLIADRISEIQEKKWMEKDLRKFDHILKSAGNDLDLYP